MDNQYQWHPIWVPNNCSPNWDFTEFTHIIDKLNHFKANLCTRVSDYPRQGFLKPTIFMRLIFIIILIHSNMLKVIGTLTLETFRVGGHLMTK